MIRCSFVDRNLKKSRRGVLLFFGYPGIRKPGIDAHGSLESPKRCKTRAEYFLRKRIEACISCLKRAARVCV
jgi:hypothetical protein